MRQRHPQHAPLSPRPNALMHAATRSEWHKPTHSRRAPAGQSAWVHGRSRRAQAGVRASAGRRRWCLCRRRSPWASPSRCSRLSACIGTWSRATTRPSRASTSPAPRRGRTTEALAAISPKSSAAGAPPHAPPTRTSDSSTRLPTLPAYAPCDRLNRRSLTAWAAYRSHLYRRGGVRRCSCRPPACCAPYQTDPPHHAADKSAVNALPSCTRSSLHPRSPARILTPALPCRDQSAPRAYDLH